MRKTRMRRRPTDSALDAEVVVVEGEVTGVSVLRGVVMVWDILGGRLGVGGCE